MNHISIVYYFKATRDLQLLSQADIIHAFVGIRENLEKYSFCTFFCELINQTQLEQPNIYLFQVLVECLKEIEKIKENTINVFFWFILKFLHISGFKPHFEACRICRKPGNLNSVRFSLIDGNYTCGNCEKSVPFSITVPAEAINYLHKLQVASVNKINHLMVISPESCETLLFSFLQYHIEEAKYLKSLKFLKQIQNNRI